MELMDIACSGEKTTFQIIEEGWEYAFEIPNQAIIDFLDEMVDCPSFVLENIETFKVIAKKAIDQDSDQETYIIGYQTIMDYFY